MLLVGLSLDREDWALEGCVSVLGSFMVREFAASLGALCIAWPAVLALF